MPATNDLDFKQYRVYNVGSLELARGVKYKVTIATAPLVLGSQHHWIFTQGSFVSLPSPGGTHAGREYYIKNTHQSSAIQLQLNGVTTSIPAGTTLHLVSDGTIWQSI